LPGLGAPFHELFQAIRSQTRVTQEIFVVTCATGAGNGDHVMLDADEDGFDDRGRARRSAGSLNSYFAPRDRVVALRAASCETVQLIVRPSNLRLARCHSLVQLASVSSMARAKPFANLSFRKPYTASLMLGRRSASLGSSRPVGYQPFPASSQLSALSSGPSQIPPAYSLARPAAW